MAVAIDIGETEQIHPSDKQDVGHRLALLARAIAYGEHVEDSGPLFRQAVPEGARMRVWFDHAGSGLVAKGGGLSGFEIAGADGKFVAAKAEIAGETVIVSSAAVAKPVYVRYGWAADPKCNLFNREQLPASPFTSEPW
jgi:sialate O-acetylesterase